VVRGNETAVFEKADVKAVAVLHRKCLLFRLDLPLDLVVTSLGKTQ